MNPATNKPYTEFFFVHGDGTDLPGSGDLFTTGSSVNLADGQLGVIWGKSHGGNDYGHFMLAGDTPSITIAPVIKLVQGTSNSSDFSGLYGWHYDVPPFKSSPPIVANSIQRVASIIPDIGTHSAEVLTAFDAPADSTRYALHITERSVRQDRTYGGNVNQYTVEYNTPADITSESNDQGKLIMGLAQKINIQSKAFNVVDFIPNTRGVMALAVDTAGGGSGTTIGTLNAGDSVDVFVYGGTTYSITMTKEHIQTFYNLIQNTAITATSKIEAVDLTTPGATDVLVVMGLDDSQSVAYDGIYASKITVDVQAEDEIATITEGSGATEDVGSGRTLQLRFEERAFGQDGNTALAGYSDQLITTASGIDLTKRYTTHIIDTYVEEHVNNDHIHHQSRIWILMEATDDSATTGDAQTGITVSTQDTSALADLNNVLGAWLLTNSTFEINGDSTTSTLFA